MAEALKSEAHNRMLVGHLPFLEQLASLLVSGDAGDDVVTLEAGAVLELTPAEDQWAATGLMQTRLLAGN